MTSDAGGDQDDLVTVQEAAARVGVASAAAANLSSEAAVARVVSGDAAAGDPTGGR